MTETAIPAGLSPTLSRALQTKGYETLTEVQEAMLAPELAGQDLLVSARTGSGKTVAFGLAFGSDLLDDQDRLPFAKQPLALIVAPTRELAMQVAKELGWLYRDAGARIATCVGGMDPRSERRVLESGAHIVVGTPGRLVDHLSRGALDLTALRAVVLDEADEMLNLGFREELEEILDACAKERRTLMFSATVGGGIAKLAGRYQRNALRISAGGPAKQHEDIAYRALVTAQYDLERAIINTLRFYEAENSIVFCSTRAAVARLTSRLANRGFPVVSISGELSQQERTNALQAMRDGRARVCVATDVAARGIDLPGLELVMHADLPKNREALLHRSGRTGRAGRKGTSVLFVPPRARRRVEQLFGDAKVQAEWASPPTADEVLARDDERLLCDPLLTEAAEVNDLAQQIASTYSAEHLAAALVRMHRDGRSAPEELAQVEATEAPRQRAPRDDIQDAVWIVLSVGRDKRAEARWLLPMLCKAGPMKKGSIGAIRVQADQTYVQLDAEGASAFIERIADDNRLEDGITVRLADGPPAGEAAQPARGPQPHRATRPARPAQPDRRPPKPKLREAPFQPTLDPAPSSDEVKAKPDTKPKKKGYPKTKDNREAAPAAPAASSGAEPRKRPGTPDGFKRIKKRKTRA